MQVHGCNVFLLHPCSTCLVDPGRIGRALQARCPKVEAGGIDPHDVGITRTALPINPLEACRYRGRPSPLGLIQPRRMIQQTGLIHPIGLIQPGAAEEGPMYSSWDAVGHRLHYCSKGKRALACSDSKSLDPREGVPLQRGAIGAGAIPPGG